jgi:hypothetical protein
MIQGKFLSKKLKRSPSRTAFCSWKQAQKREDSLFFCVFAHVRFSGECVEEMFLKTARLIFQNVQEGKYVPPWLRVEFALIFVFFFSVYKFPTKVESVSALLLRRPI